MIQNTIETATSQFLPNGEPILWPDFIDVDQLEEPAAHHLCTENLPLNPPTESNVWNQPFNLDGFVSWDVAMESIENEFDDLDRDLDENVDDDEDLSEYQLTRRTHLNQFVICSN
jgi:hypothetical protein